MKTEKSTKGIMDILIAGIPLPIYLGLLAVVVGLMIVGKLPKGIIGAFAIMMTFGGIFNVIGNHTPIVKTYLGGGAIVCIFASAALVYFGLIPEAVVENVNSFMNTTGFLNFYIAALITGSILGMSRELLLKASVRFLPVALIAMTLAILLVGVVGMLMGYGFVESIMFIAVPMMGGGMGAGVVPLSGMYAEALPYTAEEMISRMVPASTLGNVMAIVGAGLLNQLGNKIPSLSGKGQLMKKVSDKLEDGKKAPLDLELMGMGLLTSVAFFLLGTIVNIFVPSIHAYAWMIILVAIGKATGIVPERFEYAAQQWSQFVMKNWTSALLVGIGISMIDLNAVIQSISPIYILLVMIVVGGVALGAGIGGYIVGFYPIESAITAGLCTTNMGGTGDIAVLSASERMNLLPFAQISTRICGALTLIAASILLKILF
ncbi:MAG: 2-hydroxycarboxylate transporter family protein [Solobacterium sp.]|nr:2-hydroxycarboxylate transporter family protein [Solobacterium sp.]